MRHGYHTQHFSRQQLSYTRNRKTECIYIPHRAAQDVEHVVTKYYTNFKYKYKHGAHDFVTQILGYHSGFVKFVQRGLRRFERICRSLLLWSLNMVQADADVLQTSQCVEYKESLHCHA